MIRVEEKWCVSHCKDGKLTIVGFYDDETIAESAAIAVKGFMYKVLFPIDKSK